MRPMKTRGGERDREREREREGGGVEREVEREATFSRALASVFISSELL